MKKGFTLVELLAVLTILAIVALIAIPVSINIIEDSKEAAKNRSLDNYIRAINVAVNNKNVNDYLENASCMVLSNGDLKCNGELLSVNAKNIRSASGTIVISNYKVSNHYNLRINDYIYDVVNGSFGGTLVLEDSNSTKKYKGIVYMDPTNLSNYCDMNEVLKNVNPKTHMFTEVKSGCMRFYIYDDAGDTYKMILDHNTTAGVAWANEEDYLEAGGTQADWDNGLLNILGPVTANKQLALDTEGWVGNPRLISANEIAHIIGTDKKNTLRWNASKTFIYSGNAGTDINTEIAPYNFGGYGSGYNYWVFDYPDTGIYPWLANNIGWCSNFSCDIMDNTLYTNSRTNEQGVYGYWTSDGTHNANDENASMYAWLSYGGGVYYSYVDFDEGENTYWAGIRPVLTLSKSQINSNINNNTTNPITEFGGTFVAGTANDMYKGIVYLDPTNISRTCNAQLAAQNVNNYGEKAEIIDGCMRFYIYDDGGAVYKMILDHNTTADVEWANEMDYIAAGGSQTDWDNGIINNMGPVTANKQLALDTEGWIGNPRLISANEIARIIGNTTWDSTQSGMLSLNTYGSSAYFRWLYSEDEEAYPSSSIEGGYYHPYGYWTSSPIVDNTEQAWFSAWNIILDNYEQITVDVPHSEWYGIGIRPVITLAKTLFGSNSSPTVPTIQDNTYIAIAYLDPTNLSTTCTAADAAANLNDLYPATPTGVTSGCMKFYIYADDGTNYTMILDHNTSGNIAWLTRSDYLEAGGTGSTNTSKGPVTANKQLAIDTAGWAGNPRLITADEVAHIVGADRENTIKWNSSKTYTSNVTDTSTQVSDIYLDGSGTSYDTWWLGYNNNVIISKSRYAWLFDNTSNCRDSGCNTEDNHIYTVISTYSDSWPISGYWTSTPIGPYLAAYGVGRNYLGEMCEGTDDYRGAGVRPVITLPKTSVTSLVFSNS